ncbi:MAG: transporter [Bacteroidetes bacterium]|nr:transporter [Bacteroidota bacterium]
MALHKKIKSTLKSNADTGFGTSAESQGGRFINKDGSFNIVKRGVPFYERISFFYKMLMMPVMKFGLVLITFLISINLVFTLIYISLGETEFTGVLAGGPVHYFFELYYFSVQTFTTVGYGRINPDGYLAGAVASAEALTGLSSFALITGILYGRFSRPRAYLRFSKNALISPYHKGTGFMFRFVSYKENHTLTNVEVFVTLGITDQETKRFNFYNLPLERSRIDSLSMNWTVVHPINEDSPFYGLTEEDLSLTDAEVYVLVRGFDDVFSNTVLQKTSYRYNEIIFDAKFDKMYYENDDNTTTIIEINKLNNYSKVNTPASAIPVANQL